MVKRMDALTCDRMGILANINGEDYTVVESHYLPEMGPIAGDGISLVVVSSDYRPRRNDAVLFKGEAYIVTRHQMFNGKPQIWIE